MRMRRSGRFLAHSMMLACAVLLADSCARPRPRPGRVTAVGAPAPAPKPGPVTELRGVWVSDTARLDWDSATANLQRAGFNTMYVNFASGGAAFYPASKWLPAAPGVSTDALSRGLQLARQRGLSVHAKFIVMFMFKTSPQFQQQMIQAERVMRSPDGRPALQAGFTWLCPSQRVNRDLVAGALTESLARFKVDGIQFDYIRFYEQPTCYCPHCRREFEKSRGGATKNWPRDVLEGELLGAFSDWRRQLITDWVRELSSLARRAQPGITVSAAVFPDLENARQQKMQDWKLWLERGYLDYACTMTYTTDLREFETLVRQQQAWANHRSQIVVGIGSWKFDHMGPLSARIAMTRRLGAPGFVLFSYDDAAARNFLPDLNAPADGAGLPALRF